MYSRFITNEKIKILFYLPLFLLCCSSLALTCIIFLLPKEQLLAFLAGRSAGDEFPVCVGLRKTSFLLYF